MGVAVYLIENPAPPDGVERADARPRRREKRKPDRGLLATFHNLGCRPRLHRAPADGLDRFGIPVVRHSLSAFFPPCWVDNLYGVCGP